MKQSSVPTVRDRLKPTVLRTLDQVPGPRGIPLLGNALALKPKELHRQIA